MRLLSTCLVLLLPLSACKGEPAPTEPPGRFSGMGALTADESAILWVGGATSVGTNGPLQDAWRYDLAEGSWTALADLPEPTLRGVAAVREGELVVFGGSTTGWTDHAWLFKHDDNSDTWEDLGSSGPAPRFKHAGTVRGDILTITGGRNNDGESDVFYADLWALDLDSMTWTEVETTGGPAGIHRHAMAWDEARGVFWVHAGFQPPAADPGAEPERSDRLWTIDPETWTWEELTWSGEGPPIRASHAMVVTDTGLLVWGGSAGDTSTWTYEVSAGTWTEHPHEVAPLSRDAFIYDLTRDGSSLYLVGGDPVSEEVPDFVADVWRLDLDSMSWTELEGIE